MILPKPTTVTLDEVKEHFEHWRKIRARQGKIPSSLWTEVKILMDRHPVNRIAQTLKITSAQIAANVGSDNNKFTFVLLLPESPVACNREPDVLQTCAIELQRPGGAPLSLAVQDRSWIYILKKRWWQGLLIMLKYNQIGLYMGIKF